MKERCDQVPDCLDKSDEQGCDLLWLEDGYNKRVPPITTTSKTNHTIVAVPVNVSMVLMKFVHIDEEEHSIEFQYEIILEWADNRVTFHNLKKENSLNALTAEDINRLWLPLVIYSNTDQKLTTRLGVAWEWSTSVTVTREGNFTPSTQLEVDEVEVFKGSENNLRMMQTYTH